MFFGWAYTMIMFNRFRRISQLLWLIQTGALWWLLLVPLAVPPAMSVPGLDKVVHVLLFLWLTLTALWIWRKTAVIHVVLILGALIELTQSLTPSRSAEMLDWLADALGVLLAWYVWRYTRISTA